MLMDVEGEMDRDLADIIAAASMINLLKKFFGHHTS